MEDNKPQVNTVATPVAPAPKTSAPQRPMMQRGRGRGFGGGGGRGGRGPRPKEQNPSGLKDKVLDLRRVTRVVAGGKRFRFRATIIMGDEKGRVAIGVAKGADVQAAVGKAKRSAEKNIFTIPLKGRTIPHEVEAKFSAARVKIKPAAEGHGLKAGGAVRLVLTMVGIKDATAKCLGRTPNKLTNAMATLEALKNIRVRTKK